MVISYVRKMDSKLIIQVILLQLYIYSQQDWDLKLHCRSENILMSFPIILVTNSIWFEILYHNLAAQIQKNTNILFPSQLVIRVPSLDQKGSSRTLELPFTVKIKRSSFLSPKVRWTIQLLKIRKIRVSWYFTEVLIVALKIRKKNFSFHVS